MVEGNGRGAYEQNGLIFHNWKKPFSPEFDKYNPPKDATTEQKRWIIRAWNRVLGLPGNTRVCAFPVIREDRFGICGEVPEAQIHHIIPKSFAARVLGWNDAQINSPFNLIPLCPKHHVGRKLKFGYNSPLGVAYFIHPNHVLAANGNSGLREVSSKQFWRQQIEQGLPFWNADFDEQLRRVAKEVYYRYLNWQREELGGYEDIFPYKNNNHPN